jgi:PAS domain S-box-containing protein
MNPSKNGHHLLGRSRMWTLMALSLSLLVCFMVYWLHVQERRTLDQAVGDMENVLQARLELTRGYLHISQASARDTTTNLAEGLSLLQQAIGSFEHALKDFGVFDPEGVRAFRVSANEFQQRLQEWRGDPAGRPARALALQASFTILEKRADLVDQGTRQHLRQLSQRLDRLFALALTAALMLLAGICALVIYAGRSRDWFETSSLENAARFQLAMEATSDGVWDWDVETGKVYYSPAYWGMLGYEPTMADNTLGAWTGRIHPEDRERTLSASQACIDNLCDNFSVEYRFRAQDGSWRWILGRGRAIERDNKGRAKRLLGTHVDVTQQRLSQEALLDSEAQFRAMFEVASVGIVQVEPRTGRLLRFNERFRDITGYSREELLARDFRQLTHPDDRERDWMLFSAAARGETASFQNEVRYQRPDGSIVWVRLNAAFIRDAGGEPVRTVGICEDITAQRRNEEEQEKLRTQLGQAQKMEAVGRLAGGVAHDFNNMLGIILGHADLALEQVNPADPLREDLLDIRKAAERSTNLTRQLLAFARKQTIAPQVLDLNHTVDAMLKMLGRLIGEDVDLSWRPAGGLWRVKMDPSQLDQILANLCVNARDAIAGVGRVTIETANLVFDDEYCSVHPDVPMGEFVMLAVSDNGCGMDQQTQDKLFEPFFTTKAPGKGTGLGLSTVYGIIMQNGGFINVYSEVGCGTTLKIYMPRSAGEHEPVRQDVTVVKNARGSETILLVEDDPTLLRMTILMLERLGYTILPAPHPQDALRLAHLRGCEIQLLLTDVVMPGMNGRQLAAELDRICPGLKVLYMSGYTANVIAHHGVLDPDVNFIQKPYTVHGLAAKLREVLDAAPPMA